MGLEEIAKLAHEVNRLYCKRLGDDSQLSWEESPDWQKESLMKGVQYVLDNPKTSAHETHESWLEEKMKQGWSYGVEKDTIKKTHPCMVRYKSLPPMQRAKDKLFKTIVLGK